MRLKEFQTQAGRAFAQCFNSILVRLKEVKEFMNLIGMKFQFHIGAIKSRLTESIKMFCLSFNSILVRLKGINFSALSGILSMFQFHIGAIKSIAGKNILGNIENVSIPYWCD